MSGTAMAPSLTVADPDAFAWLKERRRRGVALMAVCRAIRLEWLAGGLPAQRAKREALSGVLWGLLKERSLNGRQFLRVARIATEMGWANLAEQAYALRLERRARWRTPRE
jgi:hypothetical protein